MLELQCARIWCFRTFCFPLGTLLVRWVTLIPLFPPHYYISPPVDAASEGEKVFRTVAFCHKRSFKFLPCIAESPFSRCLCIFELAVLALAGDMGGAAIRHPTHAGSKAVCFSFSGGQNCAT